MAPETELVLVLAHRRKGHLIGFHPDKGEAWIYCFACSAVIIDGDRDFIHELYESALQFPGMRAAHREP